MERNSLISSKCYGKTLKNVSDNEYRFLRDKYDLFLNQPLTLGMFVPCDEDGNVLERACDVMYKKCRDCSCREYEKAKSKVIFEGFKIEHHENQDYSIRCENNIFNVMWKQGHKEWFPARGLKTIEDLVPYNLTIKE